MKRRQFIRYASTGALSALRLGFAANTQAQTSGLSVQWLGHMCFLFSGDGQRILTNPFRSIGCTAGYRVPKVNTDLVLISSQLLDEGAVEIVPGNPQLLYDSGVYQIGKTRLQGIRMDHDRVGGLRFGSNIAWLWKQAGINILHLGGAATPISLEQKILMGRPDVLLVPVGGGPKAYTPEEAKQAVQTLNPKLIIPIQYRTQAANAQACDLVSVDNFISLMGDVKVRRANGDAIALQPKDLPSSGTAIQLLNYRYG
jgi:L-ascorbate metabolism protein UlaG (beta-lactamase superfamily)